MASIMCQGLQSCLEPKPVEPRVDRPKLSPPNSIPIEILPSAHQPKLLKEAHSSHIDNVINNNNNNDDEINDDSNNKNDQKGGWNFIQALYNPLNSTKEMTNKNEQVYIHPLDKRFSSTLSSKSLEMCTESLGCETGSDISNDEFSSFSLEGDNMQLSSDDFSSISWDKEKVYQQNDKFSSITSETNKSNRREFTKMLSSRTSFPPPLTSISGSDSVQVRPHREGGRLVIKAVTISTCHTYFQADRTNGRLRLSLLKECAVNCDCDTSEEDVEEVFEHEEEEIDEVCCAVDMEGNRRKAVGEIGNQEFPRLSRCKEGRGENKGMSSWGHFCVVIS